MKHILVAMVMLVSVYESKAQDVVFEAEAYSRLSIGSDPAPFAWGWLSWNSKKHIGVFAYTGIASPKWVVSTAGIFFNKKFNESEFEYGAGFGIETPSLGMRGNAFLLLVHKKYALFSYGEYGTSGAFWFSEATYQAHPVLGIGIRNQMQYLGPLMKFGNERISYWMTAGYDIDAQSSGVIIGLYTSFPMGQKKKDIQKEP